MALSGQGQTPREVSWRMIMLLLLMEGPPAVGQEHTHDKAPDGTVANKGTAINTLAIRSVLRWIMNMMELLLWLSDTLVDHDHDGVENAGDEPAPATNGQEHTHDTDNGTVSDVSDSHTHAETDKTLADHEHGTTTSGRW